MDLDPESIRSLVSSWVGGAAEEEEDTESKSSVLYEGRPERCAIDEARRTAYTPV